MQIAKISVRTYCKDWWQAVITLASASRTGFSLFSHSSLYLVRLDISWLDWVPVPMASSGHTFASAAGLSTD